MVKMVKDVAIRKPVAWVIETKDNESLLIRVLIGVFLGVVPGTPGIATAG